MKKKLKILSCLTIISVVIVGILSLVSCNSNDLNKIKEIPVQGETDQTSVISPKDLGTHFSMGKGFNWVNTQVPTDIGMFIFDSRFRELDYYFFLEFNHWFKELKFHGGFMPISQKENLDCDNFAMLYKGLMSLSSYKAQSDLEPGVCLVVVEQHKPFGGIPAGGLHMLNLVFTNNGWYIFEPQTNKFVTLESYPNRQYIQYIIL